MMDDRALPHNLDAEKAVLGAILMQNDLIDAVAEIIVGADFYRHAHQILFDRALQLHARREVIDLVTLKNALTEKELSDVDGPAYIASLIDGVPRTSNAAHYARIVREKATRRDVIFAARKAMAAAYDSDDDATAVLDVAQQEIFGIYTHRQQGGFRLLGDVVMDEVLPQLEQWQQHKRAVTGVPSGLIDLDYMTSGFQNTDLVIIAARPSMGKTSLVMNIAQHVSMAAEQHVGVFSLEMSRRQLALRAVLAEAEIDGRRAQAGLLGDRDWARLSNALGVLGSARLHIDDQAALSLHEIRARARRMKVQVGLDLLIVDYIQLIRPTERRKQENRTLELGEISRGLKALAKDLGIPVIALSQLSRAPEARSDHRPMLSDLRESGSLEQDADVVMFIYRDEVYNKGTEDRNVAELILAKQRNGPTGTVRVGFQAAHTRFFNLHHDSVGQTA